MVKSPVQLKWSFLVVLALAPVFAIVSYLQIQHIERTMRDGVEYRADIVRVETTSHEDGRNTHRLNLQWVDSGARTQTGSVTLSSDYASSIITNGRAAIAHVPIRALEGQAPIIVADESSHNIPIAKQIFWISIALSAVGLIVVAILFWRERQRRKDLADEVDASLAYMRGEKRK